MSMRATIVSVSWVQRASFRVAGWGGHQAPGDLNLTEAAVGQEGEALGVVRLDQVILTACLRLRVVADKRGGNRRSFPPGRNVGGSRR